MFGLVFLSIGVVPLVEPTFRTGLRILIMMGLVAVPVTVSGLASASTLSEVAWLDASAVSRHELAGHLTLAAFLCVATASAFVLVGSSGTGGAATPRAKKAVVVLAFAALGMSLWTCELGGAIRHRELPRLVRW